MQGNSHSGRSTTKESLNRGIPWLCSSCKNILGFSDENKEELRFKYKDFYLTVRKGSITVMCRKCGKTNSTEWLEPVKP